MKVFLLKNVVGIGIAGEIIKAKDGFAVNYLIPQKLGVEVTPHNEQSFLKKLKVIDNRKDVIASKTSILAEKIKDTTVIIKRKTHDNGKLFGSISASEIADEITKSGITVSKNQVEIDKSIKSIGTHEVTIKLSSSLLPKVTVKVVAEQ
ncbi:MAG TPA: 50S ribosomal protein L9 [Candidatus Babeliales bacterium]|nr:50S ribosomal protein L9 [Candidatus Babeliales bacterium]